MVFGLVEVGVLVLAVIVAIISYKLLKSVTHIALHIIIGAVILLIAKFVLGYQIAFSWLVIVVIALSGSVGAIIIIILHALGIAF